MSNPALAESAINNYTEFLRNLVESWTWLCFSASRSPWVADRALMIGLSVSTPFIAIKNKPEMILDSGGTSPSRTSCRVPSRTKFSISRFHGRTDCSLRIRGSFWYRTSMIRTLGLFLRLAAEDLHGRLDDNFGSEESRVITRALQIWYCHFWWLEVFRAYWTWIWDGC